jgi:nucleotide-binding universal stress UspA family protein
MRTVLLAYDGSDSSNRALRFLLDLAPSHRPDQIHVLNAQPFPVLNGRVLTHDDVRIASESQIEHGRQILGPAETQLRDAGMNFHSHVTLGEPEHAIAEHARALGCDHVVMGTRGMGRIQAALLGSVAMKAVHLLEVPVTLIK